MTDERAAKLAELLGEYIRASIKEGATLSEVGDWTVLQIADDLAQTHPDYLPPLDPTIVEMAS